MGACIIINAPTVFSVAWKMLKGFLDPRTVAKVSTHEAGLCALAASTVPLLHATRSPSPLPPLLCRLPCAVDLA